MITRSLSTDERSLSYGALADYAYTAEGAKNARHIAAIRIKLDAGSDPISFTNKEANVLMDALVESDEDLADSLSERLTGRVA